MSQRQGHWALRPGDPAEGGSRLAVVVTVAKGYDLGYVWKTQEQHRAQRTIGGYYINAAQAGEPPGRWWGPGAQILGLTTGQIVQRKPYVAVYRQIDPRTGAKLGRPRGRYPTFADHLARLKAAEPHATAERLIELEREAAAGRHPRSRCGLVYCHRTAAGGRLCGPLAGPWPARRWSPAPRQVARQSRPGRPVPSPIPIAWRAAGRMAQRSAGRRVQGSCGAAIGSRCLVWFLRWIDESASLAGIVDGSPVCLHAP